MTQETNKFKAHERSYEMKKLFSLLACCIIFCTLLASCGTGNGNDGALIPTVGENGNWWISSIDTGVASTDVTITSIKFNEDGCLIVTFSDDQIINVGTLNTCNHTYGEWFDFSANGTLPCDKMRYYRICSECENVQFRHGTQDDHILSTETFLSTCKKEGYDLITCSKCSYEEKTNYTPISDHTYPETYQHNQYTHWLICTVCKEKISSNHVYDEAKSQCSICERPSKNYVYWRETQLIFEMSEHSQYGELTAGTRRYYAGDAQGKTDLVDRLVAARNEEAAEEANVRIEYTYLSDSNNAYAWASNVQRIFQQTKTYGPGSVDIYCNFAYDITCSALKGCFANLRSTSYGQGNNFFRFNDADYVGTSDNYFDAEAGEGYFFDYMKSISLSDDKLYCLGSNYCTDLVRAFLVMPVNISLMNKIDKQNLPTNKVALKDGQTNIEHFYDIVWSNNWTYDELAKYSQAVYIDLNTNNADAAATSNFGDRLGLGLAGGSGSGLVSAGLLYSSSVKIVDRIPIPGKSGQYEFIYPETNPDLVEFTTALANLITENASKGICVITRDQTGAATELQGIRNEFAAERMLFGGIIAVGSLEDEVYQNMRSDKGFGIAPVPLYKSGTDDEYLTLVHNNARIVAVAGLTDKFEQCSAFLDYQSRNSAEILDTYYTENLAAAVQGEVSEDNNAMLTYIRNHVNDCFDKTFEDIIGDYNKTVDPQAAMRRWHEYIRYNGYVVTNMAVRYQELYEAKQADMDNVLNQWKGLI